MTTQRPRLPRKTKRGKGRPAMSRIEKVEAVVVSLWKRLDKLEGKHRRIGFQTVEAVGDVLEQTWSDDEEIPEET